MVYPPKVLGQGTVWYRYRYSMSAPVPWPIPLGRVLPHMVGRSSHLFSPALLFLYARQHNNATTMTTMTTMLLPSHNNIVVVVVTLALACHHPPSPSPLSLCIQQQVLTLTLVFALTPVFMHPCPCWSPHPRPHMSSNMAMVMMTMLSCEDNIVVITLVLVYPTTQQWQCNNDDEDNSVALAWQCHPHHHCCPRPHMPLSSCAWQHDNIVVWLSHHHLRPCVLSPSPSPSPSSLRAGQHNNSDNNNTVAPAWQCCHHRHCHPCSHTPHLTTWPQLTPHTPRIYLLWVRVWVSKGCTCQKTHTRHTRYRYKYCSRYLGVHPCHSLLLLINKSLSCCATLYSIAQSATVITVWQIGHPLYSVAQYAMVA